MVNPLNQWFRNGPPVSFPEGLMTKKTITAFLFVGIMVLSIPIAVELVQTQQNLKSQASIGSYDPRNITSDQCGQAIEDHQKGVPGKGVYRPETCPRDNGTALSTSVCTLGGVKTYQEMKDYMAQQGWKHRDEENNQFYCELFDAYMGQHTTKGECRARVQEEYRREGTDGASRDPLVQDKVMAIGRAFRAKMVDDRKIRNVTGWNLFMTGPDGITRPYQQDTLFTPNQFGTYRVVAGGGDMNKYRCEETTTATVVGTCATSCSQCIVNSMGPVFLAQMNHDTGIPGTCDKYDELVNIWCSRTNPVGCNEQKNTFCAKACSPVVNEAGAIPHNPYTSPTQISVACSSDNTKATIQWPETAAAMGYQLRVDNTTKGGWASCDETKGDFCRDKTIWNSSPNSSEIPINSGDQYELWVHAYNLRGSSINPAHVGFSCPGGLSSVSPTAGANPTAAPNDPTPTAGASSLSAATNLRAICLSGTQVNLRWKRVPAATNYIVRVGDQSSEVTNPSNSLTRPYLDFTTQPGQNYTWSVQAVSGSNRSDVAQGVQFSCN